MHNQWGKTTEDATSNDGEYIWSFHFMLPLFRNPGSWIRATITIVDQSSLCSFWHHLLYLTSSSGLSSLIAFPSSSFLLLVFSTKIAPKTEKTILKYDTGSNPFYLKGR